MAELRQWTADDAASRIARPGQSDDKYSRGVLGVITGSTLYPGAAVLGVEAALHTGLGMLRYRGPARAAEFVLQRRPEAVTAPGRVQAWLIGSGMDKPAGESPPAGESLEEITAALGQPVPTVLDAGALELLARATGPVLITPHAGELGRLLQIDRARITEQPQRWARTAADELGVTVLLKGHTSYAAGPGVSLSAACAPSWLATAGAGDALAGILGALVATHSRQIADDPTELARLAATAAVLHGLAAQRASGGGPLTILGLTAALPATIAELLRR